MTQSVLHSLTRESAGRACPRWTAIRVPLDPNSRTTTTSAAFRAKPRLVVEGRVMVHRLSWKRGTKCTTVRTSMTTSNEPSPSARLDERTKLIAVSSLWVFLSAAALRLRIMSRRCFESTFERVESLLSLRMNKGRCRCFPCSARKMRE